MSPDTPVPQRPDPEPRVRPLRGQRALNRVFGGLFVGVGVLLAAVH